MYNIAIVGDLHIDTKVSSRKDDYFQTCLQKINEVCSNCKNIIFLGDVFNRPTLPNDYFSLFYTHLNYLKSVNGNNFYTIIGNHDIYNENEESLNKTALGLCKVTGLIDIITPENPMCIDGYKFYSGYVSLEKTKQYLKDTTFDLNSILLLHQYFEDTYEGLTYSDFEQVNCNKIFFGHEHTPFNNFRKIYGTKEFYRCGSLLRNSANDSNLSRHIYYFILDNNEVKVCKLDNVQDAQDVFTEKAYNRENLNRNTFIKNINEVVLKYKENISVESKFSIKNILTELNTSNQCMAYIEEKYKTINEVFC